MNIQSFSPSAALSQALTFLAIGLQVACAFAHDSAGQATPTKPDYLLQLDLNEFSILNVSLMDGLLKYAGSVDLKVRIAREGTAARWLVTLNGSDPLDAASIYVAEKAVKLIQSLDPDNLSTNSRIALYAVKSLTEKMEHAKLNPVWEMVTLSGTMMQQNANWCIVGKHGRTRITGAQLDQMKSLAGRRVIASGHVKIRDEFEVLSFREKKTNALELFVMGFCPFAQRAELAVLDALEKTPESVRPTLEIRYIFYKREAGRTNAFTALHGEAEVQENLAQMVLRDRYPQLLPLYLRQRASCGSQSFSRLASQLGLLPDEIREIERTIIQDRDALIQSEYAYVAGTHGILDGSPTYVWESERVTDFREVDALKNLTLADTHGCSQ